MTQLGNQLKSQTLDTVVSTTFNTVGGRVFPDLSAEKGLLEFIAIVDSWRATHAQAFGAPLPNAGVGFSVSTSATDTPVDLVAAVDNQVVRINAISTTNAGGAAPVAYSVHLGDTLVISGAASPSSTEPVTLNFPLYISKGQTLTLTATSGTASDLAAKASGVNSCS